MIANTKPLKQHRKWKEEKHDVSFKFLGFEAKHGF